MSGVMFAKAQAALNRRFLYVGDAGFDRWRILNGAGALEGDCEDYAITLIWLAEGLSLWRFWWALITFRYLIWFGRSPRGRGHVMLWVRGRGWTDNNFRRVVAWRDFRRLGYRRYFPFIAPFVALKMGAAWLVK